MPSGYEKAIEERNKQLEEENKRLKKMLRDFASWLSPDAPVLYKDVARVILNENTGA